MTIAELKRIGKRLYGYGWQTRMAKELGVNGSTVRRWIAGRTPIPGPAIAALRCLAGKEKP